jgi:surface antigen
MVEAPTNWSGPDGLLLQRAIPDTRYREPGSQICRDPPHSEGTGGATQLRWVLCRSLRGSIVPALRQDSAPEL